jgi:hypothetical protein
MKTPNFVEDAGGLRRLEAMLRPDNWEMMSAV